MKILVLTHEIPGRKSASDIFPFFYYIKHISKYKHKLNLISFNTNNEEIEFIPELEKYCSVDFLEIVKSNSIYSQIFSTFRNMFYKEYLFDKFKGKALPNLLDYYFNPHMRNKILKCINEEKFDLIYCARTMANYIENIDIPKVVQPFDATYDWNRQMYSNSRGVTKAIYYMMYKIAKNYETNNYKKFDACLFVTKKDKELINKLSPETNCIILPNGVDTEYFTPFEVEEDFPSLVYVSDMRGRITVDNVLFFYNEVYPIIQKKVPNTKVYLVGRSPAKEILDLTADSNIIVTGTVDDVRPYIAKASIFIAPMIMGTGIKNKVLEAMSMGKAVVTTTIGAQGINGVNGTDFLVRNEPDEFAKSVIQLLSDKKLRELLGRNARKLIEDFYSWGISTEKLNKLFTLVVDNYEK